MAMDGVIQESPLKKGRVRPENFVCQTVELIEWMDARQSDIRVAVEVGNASEVSRLAAMLAEGASRLKSWTEPINGDQCGGLIACNLKALNWCVVHAR